MIDNRTGGGVGVYRQRSVIVASLLGLIAMGMLVGCGSSSFPSGQAGSTSETAPGRLTTTTESEPTSTAGLQPVTIMVNVLGLLGEGFIPKRYTCDGTNESPPVQLSGVPSNVKELVMFLVNLQPVHGKQFIDWAVAGLKPSLHSIPAGAVPSGAVVGRNSLGEVGYSICPPRGTHEEHFVLRVLGLPRPLPVKRGFDGEAFSGEAERHAIAVGLGGGLYTRP